MRGSSTADTSGIGSGDSIGSKIIRNTIEQLSMSATFGPLNDLTYQDDSKIEDILCYFLSNQKQIS